MSDKITTTSYIAERIESRPQDEEHLLERKNAQPRISAREIRGGQAAWDKIYAALAEAQNVLNASTATLQTRIRDLMNAAVFAVSEQVSLRSAATAAASAPSIASAVADSVMQSMTSINIAEEQYQAATNFLNLLQANLNNNAATLKELLEVLEQDQKSEVLSMAVKKAWAQLLWQLKNITIEQEKEKLEKQKKITAEEYKKHREEIDALMQYMEELALAAQKIIAEQNDAMMRGIGESNEMSLQVFLIQQVDAAALALLASLCAITNPWKHTEKPTIDYTILGSLFLVVSFLEVIRCIYELKVLAKDYNKLARCEFLVKLASAVAALPTALRCVDGFLKNAYGIEQLGGESLKLFWEALFPIAFVPDVIKTTVALVDVAKKLDNGQASWPEVAMSASQVFTSLLNLTGFLLSGSLIALGPIGWGLLATSIIISITCKTLEKFVVTPTTRVAMERDIELAGKKFSHDNPNHLT